MLAKRFAGLLVEHGAQDSREHLPQVLSQNLFARELSEFLFCALALGDAHLENGEPAVGGRVDSLLKPFSQRRVIKLVRNRHSFTHCAIGTPSRPVRSGIRPTILSRSAPRG